MKKNNKGFTLAELLIVVAIIAVLVAVSIPTFNNQLEKSRQSTDLANLRDAYAAAKIAELNEEVPGYTLNADTGVLETARPIKIAEDWDDSMADKYSGVCYAFWYDSDSGKLFPESTAFEDPTAGAVTNLVKVTAAAAGGAAGSGSSIVQTSLKARGTKIVIDTSNLPGGNNGLVHYGDEVNLNSDANPLPGDSNEDWPAYKILVEFSTQDGLWGLYRYAVDNDEFAPIRFADIDDYTPHLEETP